MVIEDDLSPQSRRWCFTVWNRASSVLLQAVEISTGRPSVKYLVFQEEETPTTKKWHVQGYAEFASPLRRNALKRWFQDETANCRAAKGSAEENRVYCTKEDSRIGGPFEKGEATRQGQRTDLEGLRQSIKEGADNRGLWEEHFPTMVKYHRAVAAYRLAVGQGNREPPEVIVYWGPTGTGKTRRVHHETGGAVCAVDVPHKIGASAWFDGYDGCANVLIDDFGGEYPINFFKRLTDRYRMIVPVKGGFVQWCPSKIYITSNCEPQHWYPEERQADRDAVARRISVCVHMELPMWTPPDL